MITLKPNQVCPYSNNCPNSTKQIQGLFCQGTNPDRITTFECNLVNNGVCSEGFRSTLDQTGKMKVITE